MTVETGKIYQTIHGEQVRILQKNERTYLVQPDKGGRAFHINHKELVMTKEPYYNELRKAEAKDIEINVRLVPEHYAITINDKDICLFYDSELFNIIKLLEVEIDELDTIRNKPIALAKAIDDKHQKIQSIIAWMNARK